MKEAKGLRCEKHIFYLNTCKIDNMYKNRYTGACDKFVITFLLLISRVSYIH